MASRAIFEVAYEGPAVDDGIMDVRELAPALLALGNVIESANKTIGDPEAQIKVAVRASFEKGSFQISLELIYKLTDQVKLFLDMQNPGDLADKLLALIGFVSGTGISLIELIKLIKDRKIKNAIILENGNIRIELPSDDQSVECIEIDEKVARLYRSRPVRDNLRQALSPLEKEGINGFSIRKKKEVVARISKEDVSYFEVPDELEAQQSTTSIRKAFVNLIEVAFEEGLKWRFFDGENKFYASIQDDTFIGQMESGKKFAKGDILEVELETTQTATSKGIKNEHKILRVINHISKPEQQLLPFNIEKQDEEK